MRPIEHQLYQDGHAVAVRCGLGRTYARLVAGDPVTVAFLGGSLTWEGGLGGGYRGQAMARLRHQFPSVEYHEINAGVGGTASDLAAFRLGNDVLVHRPDLVFIEFAVNDSLTFFDEQCQERAEGIVRRIQRILPDCEICFVYTLARGFLNDINCGACPPTVAAHEAVACHYGLPSINLGNSVYQRLLAGTLEWSDFARDRCHPTADGYALYATAFDRALQLLLSCSPSTPVRPAPLTTEPWEFCDMWTISPDTVADGWSYRPLSKQGGWECFDGVLEANQPGSVLHLPFTGRGIGLYYLLGPETGDLWWAVDDGPERLFSPFDEYAVDVWRPHYGFLTHDLAVGEHTVSLRVSATADPASSGTWTKLAHLLVRER